MPAKKKARATQESLMPPPWVQPRSPGLKPITFHPSPEDEVFAAEYMATLEPTVASELAQLAATMAPSIDSFDAEALISQAMAIRTAALNAPEKRRTELLANASTRSIHHLETRLKTRFNSAEAAMHLKPVAEAANRLRLRADECKLDGSDGDVNEVIGKTEAASGQMRPSLPCDHETAFKWALSAPKPITWSVLEGACCDLFCIESACDHLQYAEDHRLTELAQKALRSATLTATERTRHEATLSEISSLRSYLENFAPGAKAPPWIRRTSLHPDWRLPIQTLHMLALIVTTFRSFWQKHGSAYEARWTPIKQKQSDAAKMTNSKLNPKFWTDESVLNLVQQFTAKFRPAQRTTDNARGFSIPGRDTKDAGEILGAFIAVNALAPQDAMATVRQALSHAEWRAVEETARGSSAGMTSRNRVSASRKKSGRIRKGHKGIDVKEETLLECLKMMRGKK